MKTGKENQENTGKHLSPIKTIRAYCLHCVGGHSQDVKACDANDPKYHVCPFHLYRLGTGRPSVKTIRKFCLQCMGNYVDFVFDCKTTDCLCYPYRLGKNPERKGIGRTAEEMRAVRAQKKAVSNTFPGKFERSPLDPTPTLPRSENKNLSEKSLATEKPPPKDQAPGPSLENKSHKRGVYPVKGEQISLFPLKGIHNPYPGVKRKNSGRKQSSSIQK